MEKGKGYIILRTGFHKEGRRWVAICEELGTSTFGRSLPEAKNKLGEAITLHLNTLEDVGERRRFFREQNITIHQHIPTREVNISMPVNQDYFYQPYIQPIGELITA